jgi:hypothetical protein
MTAEDELPIPQVSARPYADPQGCKERKDEDVREHAEFLTDILNNLLVTLGKNDALNIKPYARYGRLLRSIGMQDILVFSTASCRTTTNLSYSGDHYTYFTVLDRGKKVEWESKEGPALLNIPGPAKYLIHTYACTSDEVVVFNLDSKKAPGLSLELRYDAPCTVPGNITALRSR